MSARHIVCGDDAFIQRANQEPALRRAGLEAYRSGEQCRAQLGRLHDGGTVLLGPRIVDVAPINLAAALRKDEGHAERGHARTIVLFESGPLSGSFVSRAHCAGADRVLSIDDLRQFAIAREAIADGGQRGVLQGGAANAGSLPVAADAVPDVLGRGGMPHQGLEGLHPAAAVRGPVPPMREAPKGGSVLMVTSGRGGVGKTTLSLLAAMALARRGMRVALVDFDLQFGDLAYLLGLEKTHHIDELVGKADDAEALAAQLPLMQTAIQDGVAFFACPAKPEQGDLVAPHVEVLVDAFRLAYDITVVNTETFWSDTKVRLARVCDMVFLVANQSLAAIQACATALGICGRLGIPLARTPCIINRFDQRKAINSTDAQFTLKGAQVLTVAEGHREVEELVGIGCPEELFMLKNPCVLDVARMFEDAAEALGVYAEAAPESKRKQRREGHGLASMLLRRPGVQ